MKHNHLIKLIGLVLAASLLAACGHNAEVKKTQAYISKFKSKAGRPIEPIPTLKKHESFAYSAAYLRSPFKKLVKRLSPDSLPDKARAKEELEAFPLDALLMVGTLELNGKKWALVKAPNDIVYRISVGNYVGQHYGRVTNVDSERVAIIEMVPSNQGEWQKREVFLSLDEVLS